MKVSQLMVRKEYLALPRRTQVVYPVLAGVLIVVALALNIAVWINIWPTPAFGDPSAYIFVGIVGLLLLLAAAWMITAIVRVGRQGRWLTKIGEMPEIVVLPVTRQTALMQNDKLVGHVYTVRHAVPGDREWELSFEFRAGGWEPWFVDDSRKDAIIAVCRPDEPSQIVPLAADGSPFFLTPGQRDAIQAAADTLYRRQLAA